MVCDVQILRISREGGAEVSLHLIHPDALAVQSAAFHMFKLHRSVEDLGNLFCFNASILGIIWGRR